MVAVEDVNEQLVLIERPIEIEFVQYTLGLDRCIICRIGKIGHW